MGWIDNSKFDLTNLQPLFTEGEAADICEHGRRADRSRASRQRDSGRDVLVQRGQRLRAVPDGRPGDHEDGQPRSRDRRRAAVLHADRHEPRTERRARRLGHGHAPVAGRVRDRRSRNLHRGADGHADLQLRKGRERSDLDRRHQGHGQGQRGLECRSPVRDDQLGRGRERQGPGSRTPRTTRRPRPRSSRTART